MVDWDGAGYEQISALQRWLAEQTLAGIEFRGDESLLDVGCGDGYVTRGLAVRLPRGTVLGVDASPRMIAAATAAPAPPGAPVRFELMDALALDFVAWFDVVVSFNTLHWVQDQHRALAGIARATRPAGRVIVQVVCAGARPSVEQIAMVICGTPRWAAHFEGLEPPFRHVDPAAYPAIAAAAGLTVTDQDVRDLTWDFGSRAAFAAWVTVGCAGWTERLPPADVAAWVDDVVAAYEPIAGGPGMFRFLQLRCEMSPAAAPER